MRNIVYITYAVIVLPLTFYIVFDLVKMWKDDRKQKRNKKY